MCTAAAYLTKHFYFGRNLDYEQSFGESVVITPRNWPLALRHGAAMETHYAMIGMAHMQDDFPLYYDAVNEKGLCIAGLNFVDSAVYHPVREGAENVAQFELIPWRRSTGWDAAPRWRRPGRCWRAPASPTRRSATVCRRRGSTGWSPTAPAVSQWNQWPTVSGSTTIRHGC